MVLRLAYTAVIPAWNAAATLADALASIRAQTIAPAAILVIDDGSTDDTAAIAERALPDGRVIRQARTGPGGATTRGIAEATTPVIAFLDADDLWLPEKMERQLARMEAEPDLAILACPLRQFRHGQPDDGTGEVRPGLNRSGIAVRDWAARQIGPIHDPPGNRGDLVDWLARARWHGLKMAQLPDILALRRVIAGSLSFGRDPARDIGYLSVVHAALSRRKAAARSSSDQGQDG